MATDNRSTYITVEQAHWYIWFRRRISIMPKYLGERLWPSLFVCLFPLFVSNNGNNLSSTHESLGVKYSLSEPVQEQHCLSRGTYLTIEEFRLETCRNCYLYMPDSQFSNRWVASKRVKYALTNGSAQVKTELVRRSSRAKIELFIKNMWQKQQGKLIKKYQFALLPMYYPKPYLTCA